MFSDMLKDPFDILERSIDWTDIVPAGSIISTSTWVSDSSDLTVADAGIAGLVTTVRISDGAVDTSYKVSNRITLASGLQYERSFRVLVRDL